MIPLRAGARIPPNYKRDEAPRLTPPPGGEDMYMAAITLLLPQIAALVLVQVAQSSDEKSQMNAPVLPRSV